MARYRKKPVVISAVQFLDTAESQKAIVAMSRDGTTGRILTFKAGELAIKTLEGTMIANVGDWVIRGVEGELYPCKPGIFARTYEPALYEPVMVGSYG